MTTMEKLAVIVNDLPANFYGTVTIGFQNSIPGTVEVKQSYRLETPGPQISRPTRDAFVRGGGKMPEQHYTVTSWLLTTPLPRDGAKHRGLGAESIAASRVRQWPG